MKKLLTGMIIGSLITCGVFYFIDKNKEDSQNESASALLELVKQKEAATIKMNEAVNDTTASLGIHSPLTIVVSGSDEYFYYRDKDCSRINKINFASLNSLLQEETNTKKPGEVMIIIKMEQGIAVQNSIELLDAIGRSGIQPGHYAEVELSENEKNCIKNYKKH